MTSVAVVGSGKWGTNLSRNFMELGALRYICEIDERRVVELQKTFKNIKICSNISEVLNDKEIEGVVIATQPSSHYELAMKAILAGKHVFVEKPMTLDVSHSEELNRTAKKINRILMVGHILLYNPAYVRLKEIIQGGKLGEICYLHTQRIGLGKVRREENALFSLAPHDIAVMLYLFGESPEALSCFGMDYLQNGIHDLIFLNLRFSGKRIGHIYVNWYSPLKVRQHTVVGTRKMAQIDELAGRGTLTVFNRHIDPISLAICEGDAEIVELPDREPLKEECVHFLQSIQSGETPRSDGNQGLDVVRILNAASESMRRKGEWMELSKIC